MNRNVRCPRGDDGQVAGIEVLPFGFLLLVVGPLLLANAWAVVDAKLVVTSAAREGARVVVEAPDHAAAVAAADSAVRSSLEGHGLADAEAQTSVSTGGGWRRCAPATVEVRVTVPAVGLPFVGGFGADFDVGASHTEIVDPYRSGLPGEADCG